MIDWTEYEGEDGESALSALRDDRRTLRTYTKRCSAIRVVVASLVEPLEAPALRRILKQIDTRIADIEQLQEHLRAALDEVSEFMKETERVVGKLARGELRSGEGARTVLLASPTAAALIRRGSAIKHLLDTMQSEDEDEPINWTLEDYVGSETGVYSRLDRLTPDDLVDVQGNAAVFGLLNYAADAEYLADLAEAEPD